MKGIILAGGSGMRLYPVTKAISKQVIPIFDKPMIYYPLSILMLAGIREILIISTARDVLVFQELLGDGKELGLSISYEIQESPKGLAEAFIIGEEFIGSDSVALILGDNLFYGHGFTGMLEKAVSNKSGATIFGYYVKNPKSNYAIPGIYFYDNSVIEKAKAVLPSERGELEITSINEMYLKENNLNVISLGRGMAWLDTGTFDGLLEASNFVKTIQTRQGIMIACLEEIAYNKGWIDDKQLLKLSKSLEKTSYGEYLLSLLKNHE